MASGVEMLGQMSETEALAGPVQGGNMVVKPNEVPVGGAAMLAKAMRGQANKGVGGIYELPSQEPKTPEFMQMAQAGLQERDPMRGMGPRKGLTPFDMANMAGAVEQAGIINFLGQQPEVTAPIRAKSHADAPATELAYITAAEKQMLLDANMHGSLEGNQPNPGPAGIQSLDDFYNYTDSAGNTQVGGGSGQNVFDSGVDSGSSGNNNNNNNAGGYQSSEDFYADQVAQDSSFADNNQNLLGTDTSSTFTGDQEDPMMPIDFKPFADTNQENKNLELQNAEEKLAVLNAKKNLSDSENKEKSSLTKLIDKIKETGNKITTNIFGDSEEDKKDKKRIEELLKEANGDKYNLDGSKRRELEKLQLNASMAPLFVKALGNFAAGITGPNEDQFDDDNYLNILESQILPGYGGNRDEAISAFAKEYDDRIPGQAIGPGGQTLGPEASLKMLLSNKGEIKEGSDLQKRLDSANYYRGNQPQTSGGLEDMVQNLTFDKIKNSGLTKAEQRAMGARLMEAREAVSRSKGNNQNNRPQVMEQTIDNMEVMPGGTVVDEEAQTMKYTSPRTGGTETNVPLQRRFRTDPTQEVAQYRTTPRTEADIYKYMTEGTTGEGIGLEPFSEYQRRRRKALGQEELGLFN